MGVGEKIGVGEEGFGVKRKWDQFSFTKENNSLCFLLLQHCHLSKGIPR